MVKERNNNKYLGIARMLESRVKRGDYALRKLPSENELAEEMGVSRMTARKALTHLIDDGILVRRMHGCVEIANDRKKNHIAHQFAFLVPPVISEDVQAWQWAVEQVASENGGILRSVIFTDWNDVLISDALRGFDGVFLMQTGVDVPQDAIDLLKRSDCPVVSLDLDLSHHGIPSINLFPQQAIWKLLDHVRKLGHTRISCLNTGKMNVVVERRIDIWKAWKDEHNCQGTLYNSPGADDTIDYAAVWAKVEFGRLLDNRIFQDTAVLCTNVWSALGVEKAMEDRGFQVGKAISVCAVNDEMLAPWLTPSLTSLRIPDPESVLTKCMKWMIAGGKGWRGSKLLAPTEFPLYAGASTGPALR